MRISIWKIPVFSGVSQLQLRCRRHSCDVWWYCRLWYELICALVCCNSCAKGGPNTFRFHTDQSPGLEVTGDDSKALTARSRRPITSNFRASIRDLLTKLDWLPPSKKQRVILLAPLGPITSTRAVCKYVKLEETTSILPTVVGWGGGLLV